MKYKDLFKEEKKEIRISSEMSNKEIFEELGDFEKEFKSKETGEEIHNPILGYVKSGIVGYCLQNKIISRTKQNDRIYWAVILPAYEDFRRKLSLLQEIRYRREKSVIHNQSLDNPNR